MSRLIYCQKLKQTAEGLSFQPYPGALGEKIYHEISAQAWQTWLARQTMFINEYRLNMLEAKAREFLATEMEKFLFTDDESLPAGYTPAEA